MTNYRHDPPSGAPTAVLIEREPARQNIELLVKMFLAGYSSEHTRNTYWGGIRQFVRWAHENRLDFLGVECRKTTFELYLRYLETLGIAPNTMAVRFQSIRSFMQWCFDEEIIEGNPCARVKAPTSKQPHNLSWANSHNVRDLRHAAKEILTPDEHAAFALMAMCAMRVGEVGRADHQHVTETDFIHFLLVFGKGRKQRKILVPPLAVAAIRETGRTSGPIAVNHAGNRMTRDNLGRIVSKVAEEAKLSHLRLTPHSLRRSWASIALDEGVPIRDVQRYLGHESINTTQMYDHRPEDTVKSPAWTYQAAVA